MAFNPIQTVDNLIANVVNQYIVRPTGGNSTSGINGFVFDVIDDEEVRIDSNITDHYIETNSAIQDHWSHAPLRFSVHGYVAELSDLFPNSFLGILTKVQSLQSVGGFLPAFAAQATQTYAKIASVVSKAGEVVNQAKNIYSLITGSSTTATKQQNAYKTFYDMWLSRQLCSVETPYGVFNNMAIENMRILQKGNTRFISDFEIVFKQLNFVSSRVIPSLSVLNPAGSGQVIPAAANIPLNNIPSNVPASNQSKTAFNSTFPLTSTMSGRLPAMVAAPVPLGGIIGVPPIFPITPDPVIPFVPPQLPQPAAIPIGVPNIMPPPYNPGVIL